MPSTRKMSTSICNSACRGTTRSRLRNAGSDDTRDSDVYEGGTTDMFFLGVGDDDPTFDAGLQGTPPAFGFALNTEAEAFGTATDAAGNVYVTGDFCGLGGLRSGARPNRLGGNGVRRVRGQVHSRWSAALGPRGGVLGQRPGKERGGRPGWQRTRPGLLLRDRGLRAGPGDVHADQRRRPRRVCVEAGRRRQSDLGAGLGRNECRRAVRLGVGLRWQRPHHGPFLRHGRFRSGRRRDQFD